jgi:hypothetical protein
MTLNSIDDRMTADDRQEPTMPHPPKPPPPRWRFDPTVNLGHVLTFAGFVFLGTGIYTALDKRVVVLEAARYAQQASEARRDADITEFKRNMREDLQAINAKLDRLLLGGDRTGRRGGA